MLTTDTPINLYLYGRHYESKPGMWGYGLEFRGNHKYDIGIEPSDAPYEQQMRALVNGLETIKDRRYRVVVHSQDNLIIKRLREINRIKTKENINEMKYHKLHIKVYELLNLFKNIEFSVAQKHTIKPHKEKIVALHNKMNKRTELPIIIHMSKRRWYGKTIKGLTICDGINGFIIDHAGNKKVTIVDGIHDNTNAPCVKLLLTIVETLNNDRLNLCPITIYSNNTHLVNTFNELSTVWLEKEWRKTNGNTLAHFEIWMDIARSKETIPNIKVEWRHKQNKRLNNAIKSVLMDYC